MRIYTGEGKWKTIDPDDEMHLGYQHEKNGIRHIDKRCEYCGKWISFENSKLNELDANVKVGFNGELELIHCKIGRAHV